LTQGIVKICDFGWSVSSGGLRKTMCGTPLYLSPEVVKGEEYDEKIDLWSIGILTYELIIGRIPFKIWSEAQLSRIVQLTLI
jgi:aurora kinase